MDPKIVDQQIELLRKMLHSPTPALVFGRRSEAEAAKLQRARIAAELERLELLRQSPLARLPAGAAAANRG